MKKVFFSCLVLLIAFALRVPDARAVASGGFENPTFSGYSLSQSNAVVARPEEPAAISYNPAGIVDLKGVQVQTDFALLNLWTFYDGSSAGQSNTQSSGTTSIIPTGYITINPGGILNDRLAIGIGSDSPFGLANKYDSTHQIVRYSAGARNTLKMFTLKPVAALKITDQLSIGAGPMWYRVFQLGTITQYPNRLIQDLGLLAGPPALPLLTDGQYRFDFSGQSWGWQAGVHYKPSKKHHFGFYFRSPVQVNTKGTIEVENSFFGGNFKVGGHAKVNFPMNMTFAYAWRPTPRTDVEIDFGYTHWGNFKRIIVHAAPSPSASDDAILGALGAGHADYHDSYAIQLGGSHKLTDKLTLRAGGYYISPAVPDHTFRPSVPDAHSLAFSLGIGYAITPNLTFDLAYFNRFWLRRHVDNSIVDLVGQSIDGDYTSYLQDVVFTLRYAWDLFASEEEAKETPKEDAIARAVRKTRERQARR